MFAKIGALVVVGLCILAGQSQAQDCVAQSVVNLNLDAYHNLTWSPRPGEPCRIDEYLVFIFHPNQPADYAFTQTQTYVDVSFLEVCEEWIFSVVPISGYTLGAERRILDKLPLPTSADLSLAYMNLNHNLTNGVTHLHWGLRDNRLGNCSLRYRVTIEEAGSPVIEDFYVDTNSIDLHFLASCKDYQFGIRAINIAQPTIEGPLRWAIHTIPGRRQGPPALIDVQTYPTEAFLWFRLENEFRNPCPLRALYVDGGAAFSQNIALSNEGRRDPVNVTLINLQPRTSYYVAVYVSNTVGWSIPTEVEFRTLG